MFEKTENTALEIEVQRCVTQSIDCLVARLKIEFPRKPRAMMGLPKQPDLTNKGNEWFASVIPGLYCPSTDTIYVSERVPPEKFMRLVSHEVGHAYNHYLLEKHGTTSLEFRRGNCGFPAIGAALIDEGIAEYLSFSVLGQHKRGNPQGWPVYYSMEFFDRRHELGYALVKPIIDRFSGAAIHQILLHPPAEPELKTPSEYQKRIYLLLQ